MTPEQEILLRARCEGGSPWTAETTTPAGERLSVGVTDVLAELDQTRHDLVQLTGGRVFVADDDGFLCEACAVERGVDLGDDAVQTWEVGGDGWLAPCVCRGCKLSIPVVVDGEKPRKRKR